MTANPSEQAGITLNSRAQSAALPHRRGTALLLSSDAGELITRREVHRTPLKVRARANVSGILAREFRTWRIRGQVRNGGQALVTVHHDQIYGRKPVITLVRELMAREEVAGSLRNQHQPILVVEGFRGSGKSALLSTLDKLLDQRVPRARLDFEISRHASVPQVLSALAFELSRKCPRYGTLRFPRFIVGQLAMSLELDLTVHARARGQVVAALERQRGVDTIRDVLVETAGDVLRTTTENSGLPVEPPGRYVFDRGVRWLTARAPGRIVLGSFQSWYGHRERSLTNDSIDVLVDLNRWARDGGQTACR